MQLYQQLLVGTTLGTFLLFGMFYPEFFTASNNQIFILSSNSVIYSIVLSFSQKSFKLVLQKNTIPQLLFGLSSFHSVQIYLLFVLPLCIHIPFLFHEKIVDGVKLFAYCYFQNVVLLAIYQLVAVQISSQIIRLICLLQIVLVVFAFLLQIEALLIYHPFFTLSSWGHYWFSDLNALFLIAISFGISSFTVFLLSKGKQFVMYFKGE